MAVEIGIRELKGHASAIMRDVRDKRARYVITRRGRPVALLTPIEDAVAAGQESESFAAVWHELERLGEEIGRGWRSPLTSAELLSDMRR